MKLLTVGLVLVTAAVAGCSSTTAGSAGAIQDDASPAAASASAAPALLGSKSVNNNVCDSGLAYKCGDIGQSGVGTVFYANSTAFACGADMTSMCNYLESAPNLWAPDSKSYCKSDTGSFCGGSSNDQTTSDFSGTGQGITWCTGSNGKKDVIPGAEEYAIGAGYSSTTAMVAVCNTYDAGNVARDYRGGGLTDWSLASKDELNALYSYDNRAAIGGFNSGHYWSSSEPVNDYNKAYAQSFSDGNKFDATKNRAYGVRPIRAF